MLEDSSKLVYSVFSHVARMAWNRASLEKKYKPSPTDMSQSIEFTTNPDFLLIFSCQVFKVEGQVFKVEGQVFKVEGQVFKVEVYKHHICYI